MTLICALLALHCDLGAQTIAEKKAGLKYIGSDLSEEMQHFLKQVNEDLEARQVELRRLYQQVAELHAKHAPQCDYKELLDQINAVKEQMTQIEVRWREMATHNQLDGYALWHQPTTTLEQLVIDYGSQEYVYLIPSDIADITVSVDSNLPIPRASWNEMLEMLLAQNGVGIKQLNPYLRQLYLLKEDHSSIRLITNKRQDLMLLPSQSRIAFVLSPEPSDVRRTWFFLEKFVNPNSTVLQMIGRDILIISQVSEVQELLKLYDFISTNRGDKEYKAVPLMRVEAEEMAKILSAIFGGLTETPKSEQPLFFASEKGVKMNPAAQPSTKGRSAAAPLDGDDNGLRIIPLSQVARAIFLVGTREEIRKAESIIQDVEDQVGEARGKIIYWYTTKHSDPEELAQVLEKIYYLMVTRNIEAGAPYPEYMEPTAQLPLLPPVPPPENNLVVPPVLRRPFEEGYFVDNRFVINKREPIEDRPVNEGRENFIVDPKTGAIVMVVEADILPRMKELIRKLDVPKKMVQIEVLLFEKRLISQDNFGLNLLRIGADALNRNITSVNFNATSDTQIIPGIFEFMFSRKKTCSTPAYDIVYRFLLSQDDVRINASPSVLALNQTQAIIEITEEISVNTGIFEIPTTTGLTLKDAFARAQYGIKIDVTPIIHTQDGVEEIDLDEEEDYVTLLTDISFQTIRPSVADRPDVTTRHIFNEVRIPDGQSVIIGGLRQKTSRDVSDSIPFLGELPGIGKFFSTTNMSDDTTEMFILLTPKIVYDPVEDLERIKMLEMCRRPGDIPEFLCQVVEAQEWERTHIIHGSLMIFFGRPEERCICPVEEYDGR